MMKKKEKIFLGIVVLLIFSQFIKYGIAMRVIMLLCGGYYIYKCWWSRR